MSNSKRVIVHDDHLIIRLPTGGSHVTALDHLGGSSLASSARSLTFALRNGASHAADLEAVETPLPQIARDYARNFLPDVIAAKAKLLRDTRTADQKQKSMRADWLKPENTPGDYRVATIFQLLAGKKPSDVIQLMHRAADTAFVAFEFYDLLGLPEAGRAEIERSVMRANIERSFLRSAASAPTMADPLGNHPNGELAAHLAKQTMNALDEMRAEVDTAVRWIDNTLDHAAILSGVPKPQVWDAVAKAA